MTTRAMRNELADMLRRFHAPTGLQADQRRTLLARHAEQVAKEQQP